MKIEIGGLADMVLLFLEIAVFLIAVALLIGGAYRVMFWVMGV